MPTYSTDLAAIAITAKASVAQVAQLHDLSVSAGHPGRIPAKLIPSSATAVATTLKSQVATCTRLAAPATAPSQLLAGSLSAYISLAAQLQKWDSNAAAPMPSSFFTDLVQADVKWRAAMTAVGSAVHQNLLTNTPPLLLPSA